MEEVWKVISDSDGHYYISNMGRMKRDGYEIIDTTGKKRKTEAKVWDHGYLNKVNGYMYYNYRKTNSARTKLSCHRLVALHFVENPCPEIYMEVNHIDGDKSNNRANNLEWVNRKLNMAHASEHRLINKDSEKRKAQARINQKKSVEKAIRPTAKYNREGNLAEILPETLSISTVRLTYKGYTYRYCDILKQQYDCIPEQLDVSHSFEAANKKRKKYVEIKSNGKIATYLKLSELPITREQMWVAFNHKIPDTVNYSMWDIIDITSEEIPRHQRNGVKVRQYDNSGKLVKEYNSLAEVSKNLGFKGFNWFNKCVKEHNKYKGYYWEKIYD